MSMNMKQFNAYYAKKSRMNQNIRRGSSALENIQTGYAAYARHDGGREDTADYDRYRSYNNSSSGSTGHPQ